MTAPALTYRRTAESAWRWVLDQVRWDDGPWIPEWVTAAPTTDPPRYRDGMHNGVGGLAHVLAEIRLARSWTQEEQHLADTIGERVRDAIPTQRDCTYFDGLVSTIGVLTALRRDGSEAALVRLTELAQPDGWPQTTLISASYPAGARINDLTLGTAGVLLGALWSLRCGIPVAAQLATKAADVLMAEAESVPTGTTWPFVPRRFRVGDPVEMPNLSHGVAGVATALALAGAQLERPDLTEAARSGAEHLVALGDTSGSGLLVPRYLPRGYNDEDEVTYSWCHGSAGASLLFSALDHAGVDDVAGRSPASWQRRCLHSIRSSGLPARRWPGFWDNDGRCCGTAGVGDVFLDSWQRSGVETDLGFAQHLADTLVERAVTDGSHTYWRFVEHRAADPLRPPGVGWMQGAAGIAAYLFRVARIVDDPLTREAEPRMDTWWALPPSAHLS